VLGKMPRETNPLSKFFKIKLKQYYALSGITILALNEDYKYF